MADDQVRGARLSFGEFAIDREDERLLGPAGPVRLGRKAYRFLVDLAELDGKLLTKDALLSSVWDGTIVSEAALTSVVKELRRALGDDSRNPRYIETVYGRGFRLLPPVRRDVDEPAAPTVREPTPRPLKVGAPPVLVVAPFTGQGGPGDHPDVADQLREEVLAGLSRFRELQLIAGAKGRSAEPPRNGGAAYDLSAMIVPHGDGTKVIARLQRSSDGVVVWTESIVVAAGSMAAGVDRIVRRIVGAALPVVDEDMFLEVGGDAENLYQAYLAAKWSALHARTQPQAMEAVRSLEAMVAQHPGFALAYPPLVRLYNTDFGYTGLGATGAPERRRALELAKDGLAADRGNAHAHSVLGFCHLWHGDLALARACIDRALSLNPYSHQRAQEAATAYMYMGEGAAARAMLDRAAELNPIPDDNYHEDMGRLLLIGGDLDAAHHSLRSILSGTIWVELYLAICELRLGMADGRERLSGWMERVARCWHAGRPPTAGELIGWIRRHHPLPPASDAGFTDVVAREIGEPASAISASR